jgi:Zn-dependent M28 family amino/carboxypeptidase
MRRALLLLLLSTASLFAQGQRPAPARTLAANIHDEMGFLASDALRGRGSGTPDELAAAKFVAARFRSFGLEEAQVQRVPLPGGRTSYNAFALLRGSDPKLSRQTILLTAHLDHLGVRSTPSGPAIYHGADDDASGTTAVLELARALASAPQRPRRSVVFACFGSEETGGQGNMYFLAHPPVPLSSIVADLEFEMIGRPDPSIRSGQLWLTGWERSNLGPALARYGAPLVADPHPEQHFFRRSDNYDLARDGIVAQTVSSYGLGSYYHTPADDLAHIDFNHLTQAIESMLPAVEWLANTRWKPSWNPGGDPGAPRNPFPP